MSGSSPILRLAVPAPLRRLFDYLPPAGVETALLRPGVRLRVPFGKSHRIGVLVALTDRSALEPAALKPALELLDTVPLLPPDLIRLLTWAADYYRHPVGEAFATALPVLLRQGRPLPRRRWLRITREGLSLEAGEPARAPRQRELLQRLREGPEGLPLPAPLRDAGRALVARGWAEETEIPPTAAPPTARHGLPDLEPQQVAALAALREEEGHFGISLLFGVTGSGKTEVYLRRMAEVLEAGHQVLVLVPEIGLTPQLLRRLRRRLGVPMAVLHSGLADGERLRAWSDAASGHARLVVGTRSALFTPLPELGLVILDEEHDPSFKQQEGFRYSARDLALVRARERDVPVILGSATPSMESLHHAFGGRWRLVRLDRRAGGACPPAIRLLDVRGLPLREGLSEPLLTLAERHLEEGGQVLFFLNRRGYAPVLLCHACGWHARCHRCDARLTLHRTEGRLRCHHCGHAQPVPKLCPACGGGDLLSLGAGTERLEAALETRFPGVPRVRIDRDSTRRRESLERALEAIRSGEARLLVGTQMVAKGHHFPDVSLVAVVDADQGLFSADFRGPERMAQTILQVAGRAGRAQRPGEVVIQTHHPEHPLMRLLQAGDYAAFARQALEEREEAGLPPFGHLVLLRAEATREEPAKNFLQRVSGLAREMSIGEVEVLGPVPAPMARRQGRHRFQLLLQAGRRSSLQRMLGALLPRVEQLPEARRVRWSVDVDPQEMF